MQTAVEQVDDGRYRGELSADWEIWGPMGGYVAAHALRAAGAVTAHHRPASLSCHFLGVAEFGAIDLEVTTGKEGRVASSHRIVITQNGRPVLDALVWSTSVEEGLEHDEVPPPPVPAPEELPSMEDLVADDERPPFKFWDNLDSRPVTFDRPWPPEAPLSPEWRNWLRFRPTATWDDPWLDATRSVVLVDLPSWPAGHRPHAWRQEPWVAPTLDLNVAFHRAACGQEWLLCEGLAPLATEGLMGWSGRVWTAAGRLVASGGGQCLFRRVRS